jgi:hypothetical protein
MRLFLIATVVAVAVALVTASAGLGGQPVTQTLTPPPPGFETCKAVGDGTLCEGAVSKEMESDDTGLVCGSGAGAFDILESFIHSEVAKRAYDADGNLVQRVRHDRDAGQFSNPTTGASVPYTFSVESTDVYAIPGDFFSSTLTMTGEMIIHTPGKPVLIGAGRTVYAPGGTVEFEAGPPGLVELLAGDPAGVGPVCAALGG